MPTASQPDGGFPLCRELIVLSAFKGADTKRFVITRDGLCPYSELSCVRLRESASENSLSRAKIVTGKIILVIGNKINYDVFANRQTGLWQVTKPIFPLSVSLAENLRRREKLPELSGCRRITGRFALVATGFLARPGPGTNAGALRRTRRPGSSGNLFELRTKLP
jgi:hypothetical protein